MIFECCKHSTAETGWLSFRWSGSLIQIKLVVQNKDAENHRNCQIYPPKHQNIGHKYKFHDIHSEDNTYLENGTETWLDAGKYPDYHQHFQKTNKQNEST